MPKAYMRVPVGPRPQHPGRDTWCLPSRPWRPVQTGTSEPGQQQAENRWTMTSCYTFPEQTWCTPDVQITHTCDTDLPQVVKVVLVVDPLIVGLQAVRPVRDVFDVESETVEELAFKQLSVEEETELLTTCIKEGIMPLQAPLMRWKRTLEWNNDLVKDPASWEGFTVMKEAARQGDLLLTDMHVCVNAIKREREGENYILTKRES